MNPHHWHEHGEGENDSSCDKINEEGLPTSVPVGAKSLALENSFQQLRSNLPSTFKILLYPPIINFYHLQ